MGLTPVQSREIHRPHQPKFLTQRRIGLVGAVSRIPARDRCCHRCTAPRQSLACVNTNLTKALSEEFAPRGVRANAIAPGPVRTPFWTAPGAFADNVAAGAGITAEEALNDVVPREMAISTGRITEPQEAANLAVFLASPRAASITGAEFTIDGGQVKTT